jgi:hypothetical protein
VIVAFCSLNFSNGDFFGMTIWSICCIAAAASVCILKRCSCVDCRFSSTFYSAILSASALLHSTFLMFISTFLSLIISNSLSAHLQSAKQLRLAVSACFFVSNITRLFVVVQAGLCEVTWLILICVGNIVAFLAFHRL